MWLCVDVTLSGSFVSDIFSRFFLLHSVGCIARFVCVYVCVCVYASALERACVSLRLFDLSPSLFLRALTPPYLLPPSLSHSLFFSLSLSLRACVCVCFRARVSLPYGYCRGWLEVFARRSKRSAAPQAPPIKGKMPTAKDAFGFD